MSNNLYIDDLFEAIDSENTSVVLNFLDDNFKKLGYDKIIIFTHQKINVIAPGASINYLDSASDGDEPTSGRLLIHRYAYDALKNPCNTDWWNIINITYRLFSRDIYKISHLTHSKKKSFLHHRNFVGRQLFDSTSNFMHFNQINVDDFKIFNHSREFVVNNFSDCLNTKEFCQKMISLIIALPKDKKYGFSKAHILRMWNALEKRLKLNELGKESDEATNQIIHELDHWALLSGDSEFIRNLKRSDSKTK